MASKHSTVCMILSFALLSLSGCTGQSHVYFAGDMSQGKTCSLLGVKNFSGETMVIPEYDHKNRLITGIESMNTIDSDFSQVTTLVLPDSVMEIYGCDIFSEFTSLNKLVLGRDTQNINRLPFLHCPISELSVNPGSECERYFVSDAYILDTQGHGDEYTLLFSTDGIIPDSVFYIGTGAFAGLPVEKITIPDHIQEIGMHAFYECENLQNIEIPGSVKRIDSEAFERCFHLENVYIEDGVRSIGDSAFSMCHSLSEIKIPESVQNIGKLAFCDTAFERIPDLGSVTELSEELFYASRLKEARIPEGIQEISSRVFWNCFALESVYIPSTVRLIASDAFKNCTIQSMAVSEDNLVYYCDSNCIIDRSDKTLVYSAETDHIPDDIERIGDYAFLGNTSLEEVHIPDSVTYIGEDVFSGYVHTVYIPASVQYIGSQAFISNQLEPIKLEVFCESAEKPDGWDDNWIGGDFVVHWDYDFERN